MKNTKGDSKPKISISGGLLDVLLIGSVYILAQLVSVLVLGFSGDVTDLAPQKVILAYVVSGGVMSLGLLAVMKLYKLHASDISLNPLRSKDVGAALLGFGAYIVLTVIAGILLRLIPGVDMEQEQDLGLDNLATSLLPVAFLALVVVPPLVEEFTFRGFLYHRLRFHRFSRIASALIVSGMFGVLHGQVNVAVDTFILSIVMIVVMERQKNLWTAVIVHALKNTLAFLVLFVFGTR